MGRRDMDGHNSLRGSGSQRGHRTLYRWIVPMLLPGLLCFGGCAYLDNWMHNGFKVGPDYCTPTTPVADEWIELNDPRVISQASGVDEPAWWQNFHDPVMDNLILAAYRQNLPLRSAELRVLEAEAKRAVAAGRLFPQVQEAFGNFQQTQRGRTGFSQGLPASVRALGTWSAGFNASWELDVWGRLRRAVESADAQLDASIADYDDVLVTLVADTAATYVEIRAFQQRLRYAQATVAIQRKSLQLAQDRFGSGLASRLDVTQAEAALHQTNALVPVLQQGLRLANNRLCVLLGVPPKNLLEELGEAAIPEPPREVVVGIPADLLRRRPDVRRAERELAAQSERIGIAASDLFPAFTIDGSINWQAADFGDLFTPGANAGFVRPGFRWDLLHYGRIVSNVAVQDARFHELVASYQQTVLEANREVEDAVVQFLRSSDRAEELRKTVEATAESVRLAQLQYSQGQIDFDRVNNLQRDLVMQQDASVAAEADVAFALIRVYRALGGGWQLRCGCGMPLCQDPAASPERVPRPEPDDQREESATRHSRTSAMTSLDPESA